MTWKAKIQIGVLWRLNQGRKMRRNLPLLSGFRSIGAGLSIAMSLALVACSGDELSNQSPQAGTEQQEPIWQQVSFSALPGWHTDDVSGALAAFQKSCTVILKKSPSAPLDSKTGGEIPYGVAQDWQPLCRQVRSIKGTNAEVRSFIEATFTPLLISDKKQSEGLFTGYYEPEINASRTRSTLYATPFLAKPADLLTVNLEQFDPSLKGKTIRGRVEAGRFIPYHKRADIEAGALDIEPLALAWAKDPIDVFFAHIQGSARLKLEDGSVTRMAFAGKNGRPYRAIGRDLVARGAIRQDQVSMQSIRAWLTQNPHSRDEILHLNPSYIFFREVSINEADLGPPGAANIPLTPYRSLAVDRTVHPLGALMWLDSHEPGATTGDKSIPFQHLMVAQDTGSAIKGNVRGDIFFGSGAQAGESAGHMAMAGKLYTLVPKHLVPHP